MFVYLHIFLHEFGLHPSNGRWTLPLVEHDTERHAIEVGSMMKIPSCMRWEAYENTKLYVIFGSITSFLIITWVPAYRQFARVRYPL